MKAAVLRAFGTPLVIEELPDPQPGAGEVVVDVVAAPVLAYTHEVLSGARQYPLLLPLAIGIGAIGRVRAVGPDATRLAPGDWVLCDPTVRARDEAVAPEIMLQGWIAPTPGAQRLQAHFRHGAFAEQVLLPLENAVPLGALTAAEAGRLAALFTLLVPYGGLLAGQLQAGQTVLISGATGHFGSAAVAVALAMGAAYVVAPGRNEAVLTELRHRFGTRVRTVTLSGDPALDEQHLRAAAPGPIDLVLDILPPLPDATPVETAARTVRPHGTVVLMGGLRVNVSFNYAHLMRNNITIKGQYVCPRDAPARMLALVRAGLLSLDELEFSYFPLDQANEAVAHAAATAGPFRYTVIAPVPLAGAPG
ncbi:MAG: alcohol dehydrogenase [Hymenobacter sp.]|nr:MAG: alcohol dehydrogenase [Hymenobacter sp.]